MFTELIFEDLARLSRCMTDELFHIMSGFIRMHKSLGKSDLLTCRTDVLLQHNDHVVVVRTGVPVNGSRRKARFKHRCGLLKIVLQQLELGFKLQQSCHHIHRSALNDHYRHSSGVKTLAMDRAAVLRNFTHLVSLRASFFLASSCCSKFRVCCRME